MGMIKAGQVQPDIPDDHVRVYVDVDVANIKAKHQEQIQEAADRIPETDKNKALKVEMEAERIGMQYTDRIMAQAMVQFQEEREVLTKKMSGTDIDEEIARKQQEIAKLEAEKTRVVEGSDDVMGDLNQ